ncbi:MAG: hypothetical protein IPK63_10295 [Candidatus Competibacteraceae bacterium]|nr:hypothetical protein [Candidatus Competibacteraceae bacterium]
MVEIAVRLYRKQNPDGTSKDWAYPLNLSAEALIVYYGRTGSVLRCAQTPRAACKGASPYEEAQKRAYQKRQNGYQDLGDYQLDAQHRVLTSIAATPTPAVPAARLYRLWSARDRTEGCAWRPDEPLAIAAFWLLLSRAAGTAVGRSPRPTGHGVAPRSDDPGGPPQPFAVVGPDRRLRPRLAGGVAGNGLVLLTVFFTSRPGGR